MLVIRPLELIADRCQELVCPGRTPIGMVAEDPDQSARLALELDHRILMAHRHQIRVRRCIVDDSVAVGPVGDVAVRANTCRIEDIEEGISLCDLSVSRELHDLVAADVPSCAGRLRVLARRGIVVNPADVAAECQDVSIGHLVQVMVKAPNADRNGPPRRHAELGGIPGCDGLAKPVDFGDIRVRGDVDDVSIGEQAVSIAGPGRTVVPADVSRCVHNDYVEL